MPIELDLERFGLKSARKGCCRNCLDRTGAMKSHGKRMLRRTLMPADAEQHMLQVLNASERDDDERLDAFVAWYVHMKPGTSFLEKKASMCARMSKRFRPAPVLEAGDELQQIVAMCATLRPKMGEWTIKPEPVGLHAQLEDASRRVRERADAWARSVAEQGVLARRFEPLVELAAWERKVQLAVEAWIPTSCVPPADSERVSFLEFSLELAVAPERVVGGPHPENEGALVWARLRPSPCTCCRGVTSCYVSCGETCDTHCFLCRACSVLQLSSAMATGCATRGLFARDMGWTSTCNRAVRIKSKQVIDAIVSAAHDLTLDTECHDVELCGAARRVVQEASDCAPTRRVDVGDVASMLRRLVEPPIPGVGLSQVCPGCDASFEVDATACAAMRCACGEGLCALCGKGFGPAPAINAAHNAAHRHVLDCKYNRHEDGTRTFSPKDYKEAMRCARADRAADCMRTMVLSREQKLTLLREHGDLLLDMGGAPMLDSVWPNHPLHKEHIFVPAMANAARKKLLLADVEGRVRRVSQLLAKVSCARDMVMRAEAEFESALFRHVKSLPHLDSLDAEGLREHFSRILSAHPMEMEALTSRIGRIYVL